MKSKEDAIIERCYELHELYTEREGIVKKKQLMQDQFSFIDQRHLALNERIDRLEQANRLDMHRLKPEERKLG